MEDVNIEMQMSFAFEQEAYELYNLYGRHVGFIIKCHKYHKKHDKFIQKEFVCSLEGQPSKKRTPMKKIVVSRT